MNAFNDAILFEKLSKLNASQQSIETLSHWCIFHRKRADQVVQTWQKHFASTSQDRKLPLLYLANDILQNSRKKGPEFIQEFWQVLPSALQDLVRVGPDSTRKSTLRIVDIWEERKVFGQRDEPLRKLLLGDLVIAPPATSAAQAEEQPAAGAVSTAKVRGPLERISSVYGAVQDASKDEDTAVRRCSAIINELQTIEKELTALKSPANASEADERAVVLDRLDTKRHVLQQCCDQMAACERKRALLVKLLTDALRTQESKLERLRSQVEIARTQSEIAANLRKRATEEDAARLPAGLAASAGAAGGVTDAEREARRKRAAELTSQLVASASSAAILKSVLSSFAAGQSVAAGAAAAAAPADAAGAGGGADGGGGGGGGLQIPGAPVSGADATNDPSQPPEKRLRPTDTSTQPLSHSFAAPPSTAATFASPNHAMFPPPPPPLNMDGMPFPPLPPPPPLPTQSPPPQQTSAAMPQYSLASPPPPYTAYPPNAATGAPPPAYHVLGQGNGGYQGQGQMGPGEGGVQGGDFSGQNGGVYNAGGMPSQQYMYGQAPMQRAGPGGVPSLDFSAARETATPRESNVPPNLLPEGWQGGLVVVPDTLGALQGLAREARRRFGGVVVGVTGSVGKTTARALTALALSPLGAVHQTQGNLNNHIGVPLTLLALPQSAAACVVEMGMSARGEIAHLSAIAAPSIRLLLNVGPAHIGDPTLGSLEAIAEAKGEMLADARPGDVCVVNGDDRLVMRLPVVTGVRRVVPPHLLTPPRTHRRPLVGAFGGNSRGQGGTREGDVCAVKRDGSRVMGFLDVAGVRLITFGRSPACDVQLLWARAVDGGMAVEAAIRNNLPCTGGGAAAEAGVTMALRCGEQEEEKESAVPSSSALSDGTMHLYGDRDDEGTGCLHGDESDADKTVCVRINSPGLHLADNALAAAAVAVAAGVPLPMAVRHMARYEPVGMRMRVERIRRRGAAGEEGERSEGKGAGHEGNGVTVLNDAYNANPISVASALHLLHQLSLESTASSSTYSSSAPAASFPPVSGRHVAVLGDMLELGSQSESAHVDALSLCLSLSGISLVLIAGEEFKSALGKMVEGRTRGGAGEGARGGDGNHSNEGDSSAGEGKSGCLHCCLEDGGGRRVNVHAFNSAQDLAEAVESSARVAKSLLEAPKGAVNIGLIRSGDVVLVKGSRGLRMELVLSSNGVSFGLMAPEAARISTTVVSKANSVIFLAPHRPSFSAKPPSVASPHQRLPQRPARQVAAVAAETASTEDDSADVPPPGCSRIKIELARPLGLVLEERAGGIFVAEVAQGGNAEATGLVDAGDQLIATSAIVFDDSDSYGGVVVKKGMRIVRFNVRGEKFDTVMAAIGTHPSYLKVHRAAEVQASHQEPDHLMQMHLC
ncbi:unnamed protein product [Closterium sp. Naga37s-1]|nr:unnamed protein product [Closterium sp. Naga37s-1]